MRRSNGIAPLKLKPEVISLVLVRRCMKSSGTRLLESRKDSAE